MKKKIIFGIVIFHLFSALVIGGYVHAFRDDQGATACPIPLAMGAACDNHVIASSSYLMGILAVPLVGTAALFFFAVIFAHEKTSFDISPLFNLTRQRWRRAFLKGSLFGRLCRWLLMHRGDGDRHPVRVFVFMMLSLCHHATIKNNPRRVCLSRA